MEAGSIDKGELAEGSRGGGTKEGRGGQRTRRGGKIEGAVDRRLGDEKGNGELCVERTG